jgi:K+-sensing histidine kinase KdpD
MDIVFLIIIVLLFLASGITILLIRHHYEFRLKKEVRRAQKSEQLKSVFLANVSRALRTPLNAIVGFSNLILDEKDDDMHPVQVKEMAANIHQNGEQLLGFIQQLLELSNFEGSMPSFTLIEVNLAELMASYRREAMNVTRPDVSVVLRSDLSPHCKATLDTNFMHQLMMHLLTEAAKNTMKGDIMVNFKYERHGLKVAITYGGVGKTDLLTEDIYSFLQKEDAMMLTKDNSRFGLSICKAIIDALGGELDFETGNGSKTVASFWFPCKMRDKHKR